MPLSFFWAVPNEWLIKQYEYGNGSVSARYRTLAVLRATTTVTPKAADTRRAVTTRTGLAADNKSASLQCDGRSTFHSDTLKPIHKSHVEPAAQAHLSADKHHTARSSEAKKAATQQHNVVPVVFKGLQVQQVAAQPSTNQLPHGQAAKLTARIMSASSLQEVETLIVDNHSRFNHIHVAASFKALFSLYQQTEQKQEDERFAEVGRLLLPLARQHAAAFSVAQTAHILHATALLQLHPGADWYHTLLQHLQDSVGPAAAAGRKDQQQQHLQDSTAAALTAAAQQPRYPLHGKQLTELISSSGSPYELDAILQHTWPAVTGIHVTAAAQQLVRMHQQSHTSQEQQQLQQVLCRNLLLHATNSAAPPASTTLVSTAATLQQQQVKLSAWQVAVLLHAVTVLRVSNLPQPHLLLQLLLQQASETAAAEVHAAALCNILSGTAWLMKQKAPQALQQLQQQQHDVQEQQQQQHESQDAVLPRRQQQHVPPSTSEQVTPEVQLQLLQQRRLLLLQQQQQQQQLSGAPSSAASASSGAPQHSTQQQQRQQILQLLGEICTSCCQPSSLLQHQGIWLEQLSSVLDCFAQLRVVPQAAVLQQLMTAAGRGSCSSGSCNTRSSSSSSTRAAGLNDIQSTAIQQQQQQQGELPSHAAGHAAAVLWQLGVLAQLEQQQQQQRPAAMLGAGISSSSRRGSSQVLQALSSSTGSVTVLLQPVCSAAAAAAAAGRGKQGSLKALYVAVAALSLLASMLAEVQLTPALTAAAAVSSGQGRYILMRAGSASGSTSAAAAAAVPFYSSNEHSLLQTKPVPGLCSIGVQPQAVQQLCEAVLTAAQQQQQQQNPVRQTCDPVKLLFEVGHILQHSPDMQQQQQHGVLQQSDASSYAASWLVRYVTAVQAQLKLARMNPNTLAELLHVLVRHNAYQLPVRWYKAVEQSVLLSVEGLQSVRKTHAKQRMIAAGVHLVHAWVQLLLVPRQLQQQAAVLKQYSSSSSSSGAVPRVTKAYYVSDATVSRVCRGLIPQLVHLDAATLGLAAWAVATLGPVDTAIRQQWLLQLMHAAAAAAAAGMTTGLTYTGSSSSTVVSDATATTASSDRSGSASGSSSSTTAAGNSSSSSNEGSTPAAAAAAVSPRVSFPPEALQRILQSFVLLRCRPPVAFLQHVLAVAAKDMALYKGSAIVGLLLVLVQLRVKPGGAWLRGLMLRVQGRLRALSFEELTQLCWCLAQLGVVPHQTWLDEVADTAALHVVAWRKQQQQQQQQQQQAGSGTPVHSSSSSSNGAGGVQAWQLYIMHWALIVCWRYRGSHAAGKLQYRLVRELNRVAWGVDRNLKRPRKMSQAAPQQQQQPSQRLDLEELAGAGSGSQPLQVSYGCRKRKTLVVQEAAALRQLGRTRRRYYRLLRSGQLRKLQPKRQQQQLRQGVRELASSAAVDGGSATAAAAAIAASRGRRRSGSTAAAAARLLASRLMRQRAAAVWPRQWDPICLAPVAKDGQVKSRQNSSKGLQERSAFGVT